MRFSTSNGHTVMGVGDATVSVDNAQVPHAGVSGEADWIDESRVGYRFRGDDGVYHLAQWALGTPQPARLDEQSATTFRAGGGVWAAFLAGSGVRTSAGQAYPDASLCDVSPAGEIVLCPNYQRGRDLQIIDRNGHESWLGTEALGADATAGPNVRFRDGVLLYQASGWHLERIGGTLPFWQRAMPINYAVPVTADGEIYVLEREAYRLTMRKASGVSGWVIATGESLWAPDAVQVHAGEILIGWAANAGETPGSLRTFAQRLDVPTVPLDGEVPTNDPAKPPSSPIITFPGYRPPPQASYGRRGYAGPYFATDLRTGNFSTPGNFEMVSNGSVLGGNQQVNRPVIVDLQSTGNDPNKMLGFRGGACDDSMGNAAIKSAWNWHRQHGHIGSAMVRYFDGTPCPQDFIDGCEREAIVQVQCYPRAGESVSTSMARFVESVDRVIASGRKCGIARGFNTKYGGLQTVLDIQDPLCAMVRSRPAVILDAWFSHGRWYAGVESGAAYCAELLAWEPILGGLFTGLP